MIMYLWPDANIPSSDTMRNDLRNNFTKVKDLVSEALQVIILNFKYIL
jgi:lambda repressor-like predicted transcriptional regulator